MVGDFLSDGYALFPAEHSVRDWAQAAHDVALPITQDPKQQDTWLQCQGTWFVGVDVLPNDPSGQVGGVPLSGAVMDFLRGRYGDFDLHAGQVSVIYPGYPKPRAGESEAGFRYRLNRDAAHVDGILGEGPQKRRYIREPHAFVLGIPLNASQNSPMTLWRGSHRIMQRAFAGLNDWQNTDVTDIYTDARKEVFETCERIELRASVGEAYVMHPLTLHGVAPWKNGPENYRMISYFRPSSGVDMDQWLQSA